MSNADLGTDIIDSPGKLPPAITFEKDVEDVAASPKPVFLMRSFVKIVGLIHVYHNVS
jgi:hypothetical protein